MQDERTPLNAEGIVEKKEEQEDENQKEESEKVPFIFIVLFYFLGAASFVPHNFYVTANEYWMYKFRDPTLPFNETDIAQKTTLQKNFTAYVGVTSSIGLVTSLVITSFVYKKIPIQMRIMGSMVVLLVLFTFTLLFIFVDTDSWQEVFFVVALLIGGLLNAFFGILLVSLLQLASKFPARCLAAQVAGQSVCGILAALVQIIALAAAPSVKATAALYFSIAIGTIAIIMVAYTVILRRSEEFQDKLKEKEKTPNAEEETRPKLELDILKRVFKKVFLLIVSLVLCMGCSGMLQPGITALMESSGKGTNQWSDKFFIPVCVFLLYNIFELIGREGSAHLLRLKNIYIILATAIGRIALFPLILFCNIQPRNHLPVVFQNDTFFIIFVILLAITGGYIGNMAIFVIPDLTEPEEKPIGMLLIVLVMVSFTPIFSILSGVIVNLI
ncbi:hypothetical protein NQ315_005161 [Exocentrus adspersus]|uniref:Equilibrative nucleoside transporter 3 n=1 Tax=Exocentrus adspersus TaxID=1586481 RepID=A0AAV8VUH7_9CUCU|nr:hypothetical protein NQ315_005161 [Exocentrus adspersus]